MKILKRLVLAIVGLIGLLLLAALFVDGRYAVEREITINKPKQDVFNYIRYLKNQDQYSKWATMDPDMKKAYRGIDGTVGFISAWKGNKDVGEGEQEIKKITEGERVDFELRFKEPMEATDEAYMTTTAITGNQTKVKWGFTGKLNYPINLMCLVLDMDEMVGPDLEVGLDNLKKVMEK